MCQIATISWSAPISTPIDIYMVQYATFQHFDQKLQKTENFYLATIFKVRHRRSSHISISFHRRIPVPISVLPGPIDCYKKAIDDQTRTTKVE